MYIGRGIDQIDNISTLDNLTFNGSDATFNLTQNSVAFVPVSADALQIQIDGVIQSGNYTVSGSTVTFDFVPSGSSICNGIRHFGVGLLTTVSDSSITTAKLGADSVNGSKIADNSISDEHLDITAITGQTAITSLADTDKFLVSDASDSGNLKYVEKQYLGGSTWVRLDGTDATALSDITYDVFSSTYKVYKIIGSHSMGSNGAEILARMRTSGTDQTSSHYRYIGLLGQRTITTASSGNYSSWNANSMKFVHGSSYSSSHPTTMEITIHMPNDGTRQTGITFDCAYYHPTEGTWNRVAGSVWVDSTSGLNNTGIKLYADSGTIDNADYSVYGLKDS